MFIGIFRSSVSLAYGWIVMSIIMFVLGIFLSDHTSSRLYPIVFSAGAIYFSNKLRKSDSKKGNVLLMISILLLVFFLMRFIAGVLWDFRFVLF